MSEKGRDPEDKSIGFRPTKENREKIVEALREKQKKERRPSINNTIEAILMEALKIK